MPMLPSAPIVLSGWIDSKKPLLLHAEMTTLTKPASIAIPSIRRNHR